MKRPVSNDTGPSTCDFESNRIIVWASERPIGDITKNRVSVAIAGVEILERKLLCIKTNTKPSGINVTKSFSGVSFGNKAGEPRVFVRTNVVSVTDTRCWHRSCGRDAEETSYENSPSPSHWHLCHCLVPLTSANEPRAVAASCTGRLARRLHSLVMPRVSKAMMQVFLRRDNGQTLQPVSIPRRVEPKTPLHVVRTIPTPGLGAQPRTRILRSNRSAPKSSSRITTWAAEPSD